MILGYSPNRIVGISIVNSTINSRRVRSVVHVRYGLNDPNASRLYSQIE